MAKKKRRSLADTLRESNESHERQLAEASNVIRLIDKEPSEAPNSKNTQQTNPADKPDKPNQHSKPTGKSDTQSQQSYPTEKSNTHYSQSDPTVETDCQSRLSNPTVESDSHIQQSAGSECWNRQSNPTDQLLDSTHDSDTQIQQTDSQAKFLISSKPKIVKTKNQKVLYDFLTQNNKLITTYDNLSEYLEISNGTIRDILRKFERNGLISKEKYVSKDGVQGLHITFQQTVPTDKSNRPIRVLDSTVDSPSKIDRSSSIYLSGEGGSMREGDKLDHQAKNPTDTDCSPEERLKNLTDNDITFYWPNLHNLGFGTHQIQQILERLAKVGKQPDKVIQGLDHAEYELENGKMADKEGKSVSNPCSYVFNSLAKHGYYRRPSGYMSAEEQAELDAKKEAERLQKVAKEKKEAQFEAWKANLSQNDLSMILEKKTQKGPTDPWLRLYWEKNILSD